MDTMSYLEIMDGNKITTVYNKLKYDDIDADWFCCNSEINQFT